MSRAGRSAPSSAMTNAHVSSPDAAVLANQAPEAPLTLREAAIVVLIRTGESLRAAQIAAHINTLGLRPASSSATPAQSINRDLHAAMRRGDPRVTTGGEAGQFRAVSAGEAAPAPRTTQVETHRGPRLPMEPLLWAVDSAGGLGCVIPGAAPGTAAYKLGQRLTRTYHRSVERGWIDLYDADTFCVRFLRTHPCMLWGPGWWDTLAEADRVELAPCDANAKAG